MEIITFLSDPGSYPHSVSRLRHLETHISHIFLTGEYAYKLKKPVKFDFLDFSTLELRKHFCEEELRLNSRYAPEIYLGVVPVSLRRGVLTLGPGENAVEYLVKMRQFDENALFTDLIGRGELTDALLTEITDSIARFHREAAPRPDFWGPEAVARTIKNNLAGCRAFTPEPLDAAALRVLTERTEALLICRKDLIRARQHTHVVETHGDLHLRNICIFRGRPRLFDGIEFNPELSNCDVWTDLAFFLMDLFFRGLRREAALVWNRYLQETDDFEGFPLLDLYLSYRAAVRARISCLELASAGSSGNEDMLRDEAQRYLALALQVLEPGTPRLIAVGGLSGTGKTTLSSLLAQSLRAVHVRSDAVRKHISGVPLLNQAPPEAYSEPVSEQTYDGLQKRAANVLLAGRTVIIDAVFHDPRQRTVVEALARESGADFIGFWCRTAPETAKKRILLRRGDISDADLSVYERQLKYSIGDLTWHVLDASPGPEAVCEAALLHAGITAEQA